MHRYIDRIRNSLICLVGWLWWKNRVCCSMYSLLLTVLISYNRIQIILALYWNMPPKRPQNAGPVNTHFKTVLLIHCHRLVSPYVVKNKSHCLVSGKKTQGKSRTVAVWPRKGAKWSAKVERCDSRMPSQSAVETSIWFFLFSSRNISKISCFNRER